MKEIIEKEIADISRLTQELQGRCSGNVWFQKKFYNQNLSLMKLISRKLDGVIKATETHFK